MHDHMKNPRQKVDSMEEIGYISDTSKRVHQVSRTMRRPNQKPTVRQHLKPTVRRLEYQLETETTWNYHLDKMTLMLKGRRRTTISRTQRLQSIIHRDVQAERHKLRPISLTIKLNVT
jgi:hypothetical protein